MFSIAILLLGLVPVLVPARASVAPAETVSEWLYGFACENSPEQARGKISELNDLKHEPGQLLKKASRMISANADLFALPLPVSNPDPTEKEIFNLLVQEWNRYQQTGSMGTAVMAERFHHALPFGANHLSDSFPTRSFLAGHQSAAFGYETNTLDKYHLQPLLSGISINAP